MKRPIVFVGIAIIAAGGAWLAHNFGFASQDVPKATMQEIAFADQATPKDTELAAIYDRSCRSCHGLDGLGAPLTGHTADWAARERARGGFDALVTSAREGYEEMPAMGLCNDCSYQQFADLITFMSDGQN